jgi:hypothetical protein
MGRIRACARHAVKPADAEREHAPRATDRNVSAGVEQE